MLTVSNYNYLAILCGKRKKLGCERSTVMGTGVLTKPILCSKRPNFDKLHSASKWI